MLRAGLSRSHICSTTLLILLTLATNKAASFYQNANVMQQKLDQKNYLNVSDSKSNPLIRSPTSSHMRHGHLKVTIGPINAGSICSNTFNHTLY